jgi:hypothetical protein
MEVGEMIFALVLALGLGGWWAYSYERRIYRFVHRSSPEAGAAVRPAAAVDRARPTGGPLSPAPTVAAVHETKAAVEEIERPIRQTCDSVLGWDAFTLTSTLALDGTVLLSCRPQPEAPDAADELTFVLMIGDDDRAARAIALLESWRTGRTTLRLRPTTVAGAIEVFDARHSAIRAPLLAA